MSVSEGRTSAPSVGKLDDVAVAPPPNQGGTGQPGPADRFAPVLRWLRGRVPAYGPPVYHRLGYLHVLIFTVLMVVVGAYWNGDDYRLGVMTTCFIYAIAAVGLYFAYSLGGLFAFSQGAFMGLGAYVSAKVSTDHGFLAGLGSAIVVTFVVALVVGILLRKARHLYFAVGALAVASLMGLLFSNWEPLAGDASGALYGIVPPGIGDTEFVSVPEIFWFTLVIMVLVMILGVLVERSPMRRNALANKEIPAVAQASGVRIHKITIMLFGFGCALAGLAGSIDAHYIGAITPDAFSTGLAINLYLMILLGGLRSIWGAVVGAMFFVWLPELLRPVQSYTTVIYSFLLLLTIIVLPEGIVGTLSKLTRKVVARVKSN